MKLSDLFLNRFLYRDNDQSSETQDAAFISADSSDAEPTPLASGGAAQDINTSNVYINGEQIQPGTIPSAVLDVSNWGWGQTCSFSSTDADTVSWGAGTFKSADGTTYSISAGNTGNMTAKTYIYLSLLDSTTVYQTTTTSSNAVGIGKVLIAVAENAAVKATYMLSEATQIVGDNIIANTIDASKITTGQLIVGTNVGLGTAQDSSGVTTIIGNTVTTGFVNALSITAGSVAAENITGTTISGKTITGSTLQTGTSGYNINITGTEMQIRNNTTVMGSWKKHSIGDDAAFTTYVANLSVINTLLIQALSGSTVQFASQSFEPYTDGTSNLGSSSSGWGRVYLGTAGYYLADSSGNLQFNGSNVNKIPTGGSSQQFLKYSSSGVPSWEYLSGTNCGSLVPSSSTVYLGSSTYYWDTAYLGKVNLKYSSSNPSSAGDIVNYASGSTDQFRGQPGDGTWRGSFDMTAY